ncbi:MAG: SDR family oxidoreductase, partial [Planctomycetota bacterium]
CDQPPVANRVAVARGDVCQPMLGLAEDEYRVLAAEVTHIVHCAGNVKLNQSLDDARHSAFDSARNIVEFARACQQHGRLQKLDVVSTIGVAGRMPGLIPERQLTEPREFHNTYEQAKAEAEDYLFDELDRGLPLTIHRPSMVVGRSDNGRIRQFQVFYHLCDLLSGKKTWGFVVDTGDATLDIVPVDYVARALFLSSHSAETIGRVFHLCSGPEGAVPLGELSRRARQVAEADGDRLPRLKRVSPRTFRLAVAAAGPMVPGRAGRMLRSLPYFLAYLGRKQGFSVEKTARWLAQSGVQPTGEGRLVERTLRYRNQSAKA